MKMFEPNKMAMEMLLFCLAAFCVGIFSWQVYQRQNSLELGSTRKNSNASQQEATGAQYSNFEEVDGVPDGIFSYGGSTTFAPIRSKVNPILRMAWPQFQLRYTDSTMNNPGSGTGIKMLLENKLAFSQSSRPLHSIEHRQAKQRGFDLKQIPVAIDHIAVAVHPDLNIEGLTLDRLKDIYTGNVTNWNQIGGPDLIVTPYSLDPKESGTSQFFLEDFMLATRFSNRVLFIANTTSAIRKVAVDRSSIYFSSAAEIVKQCSVKSLPIGRDKDNLVPPYRKPLVDRSLCPQKRNQLNLAAFHRGEYPLTRRLFVIVKQDGKNNERAGLAYAKMLLSAQGQKLIEEAGFVSLYPVEKTN